MHFFKNIFLFLSFGLLMNGCLLAQQVEVVQFNASNVNSNVFLDWKIGAGSSCTGIGIYHSLDAINFEKIGQIDGVCGSETSAIPYSFTHNSPTFNTKNYYRLVLGGSQNSEIIEIEIIEIGADNYILRPNPITNTGELHFKNDTKQQVTLKIFDLNGTILHEETTTESFFLIQAKDFKNGKFNFQIQNELKGEKLNGKLMILK